MFNVSPYSSNDLNARSIQLHIDDPPFPFITAANIQHLRCPLNILICITVKPFSMSLTHNDRNIVAAISAVLNKEYRQRHSHARLAHQFHLSDRKLRRIFKQETGKTINEFLTGVRIEKAKELLCNTDDPIKKIACSVGYYNRNLERQFKFFTGMTPLGWRNQNQRQE